MNSAQRLCILGAAILLAIAAVAFVRVPRTADRLRTVAETRDVSWTALALDDEAAWRLRLVELTLARGRAPTFDRGIDAPRGRAVPWPTGWHTALAGIAERLHANQDGPVETGGVSEERLIEFAIHAPLAAWIATVLALTGLTWSRLRAARGGTWLALAGIVPAYCLVAPFTGLGAFSAAPFAALFGLATTAAFVRVQTARQASDWALCALLAGALAAAGVGCDLAVSAVLLVGVSATAVRAAWEDEERSRDLTRAGLLAVAAALALFALVESTRGAGESVGAAAFPLQRFGLVLCLFPLAGRILAGTRLPRSLVAALVVIVPLAIALLDRHLRASFPLELLRAALPAGLAIGAVLGAFAALARWSGPRWIQTIGPLAGGVALVVCSGLAWNEPNDAELERRADTLRMGHLLRTSSPSSGPWNDPGARPDWIVETTRGLAGTLLLHGRRAVRARADETGLVPGDVRYALLATDLEPVGFELRAQTETLRLWERDGEVVDGQSLAPR